MKLIVLVDGKYLDWNGNATQVEKGETLETQGRYGQGLIDDGLAALESTYEPPKSKRRSKRKKAEPEEEEVKEE